MRCTGVNGRASARRVVRRVVLAGMLACVSLAAASAGGAESRVPLPNPVIAPEAGDKCVEDTAFMRRNHMELLMHHRAVTVHEGIRTTQHSLAGCIACHASRETGRVTGSKDAFCETCHAYAAVKLDCFECHTDRAKSAVASATGPDRARQ